jgi:hypothetical protein
MGHEWPNNQRINEQAKADRAGTPSTWRDITVPSCIELQ